MDDGNEKATVLSRSMMIRSKEHPMNAFGLSGGQRDLFSAFAFQPLHSSASVDQLCDERDCVSHLLSESRARSISVGSAQSLRV